METKEFCAVLATLFAGVSLILSIIIFGAEYSMPYKSCVRAQIADQSAPTTEAEAHLICGRWVGWK